MNVGNDTSNRTYMVAGMTCGHCESSVREELSGVAGVESVDVDLGSGQVTVTGSSIDDAAIEAAVVEAGYEVLAP